MHRAAGPVRGTARMPSGGTGDPMRRRRADRHVLPPARSGVLRRAAPSPLPKCERRTAAPRGPRANLPPPADHGPADALRRSFSTLRGRGPMIFHPTAAPCGRRAILPPPADHGPADALRRSSRTSRGRGPMVFHPTGPDGAIPSFSASDRERAGVTIHGVLREVRPMNDHPTFVPAATGPFCRTEGRQATCAAFARLLSERTCR